MKERIREIHQKLADRPKFLLSIALDCISNKIPLPMFSYQMKMQLLVCTGSYVRYTRDFIGAGKCFGVGRIFALNFPKNVRKKTQRKTSKNTFAAFVSYQR